MNLDDSMMAYTTIEQMKKRIDQLEKENAELKKDKWISCSDILPNIDEAVLTCSATGNIEVLWRCEEDGIYEDAYCSKFSPTVVAWQPLPAPYKADETQ